MQRLLTKLLSRLSRTRFTNLERRFSTIWIFQFFLSIAPFEIFIFCPKIQLWFPEKIVYIFGWKTRENVVVLDFLAVDNCDFTRKIVKKNLDEIFVEMLWFLTFRLVTTLISREKLSKKISVKNSWKCIKIEFLDKNLTFRIVCPCHLKTSLLKITYPSFLGWQDILALVKSWVLLGKNFQNSYFLTWTLDLQKPDPSPRKKCFSKFFFFFLRRPIRFHCIIIKTRSCKLWSSSQTWLSTYHVKNKKKERLFIWNKGSSWSSKRGTKWPIFSPNASSFQGNLWANLCT